MNNIKKKILKVTCIIRVGVLFILLNFPCSKIIGIDINPMKGLRFKELPITWDEAIPLGNGMVGTLIWQKDGKLRFSLDRADLWDLRPMKNIDFSRWKFNDVYEHWKSGNYGIIQHIFDEPYEQLAAPSKIPAGAIEFNVDQLGEVESVNLDISTAMCIIRWKSGAVLTTFVHAEKPLGWYKFENLHQSIKIELKMPAYNENYEKGFSNEATHDLRELGYSQGIIHEGSNYYTYFQRGWGGFSYQVHTEWKESKKNVVGCWSISSSNVKENITPCAREVVAKERVIGIEQSYEEHLRWWHDYWSRSMVKIPDSLLMHQYYMDMYKFGSAARAEAPPISLQAVWTADNGKLPPWKGDFHHDLNTELSYWPAYTGNHLDLEEGFINWLWNNRYTFKKNTKEYFGVEGFNVHGVTTLEGEPMGGWIQYSMGQTISAWLAQHFYLHWRYTKDKNFLKQKAYPWLKGVAIFLDKISVKSEDGTRKLLISSSPEFFDNSSKAWFNETTNFDLALIRWTYEKAAELAKELNFNNEAKKWNKILSEWPELNIDPKTGLTIAPGVPYDESHRHFSHLIGFHPLGIIDYSHGEREKGIINNSLLNLEECGTEWWTGFSFSWAGNLYARAFEGEKAANVLRIFSKCFCLKNSFHVNGDQCKAGYSNFTYRPFTLEGNFAFASAIQEMLIQSHTGIIKIFPAIPEDWHEVEFKNLRADGAFLVSAKREKGSVSFIEIFSEKGGECILDNPFADNKIEIRGGKIIQQDKILRIITEQGEMVKITTGFQL